MKSKAKGTVAERQLMHMFHKTGDWAICRSAGSGSTPLPNPDLVVGSAKHRRVVAIECKSVKGSYKYLSKEDKKQLEDFSRLFGAEPWFGVRFDKRGWFFIRSGSLKKSSGDSFVVTFDFAKKNGLSFDEFVSLDKRMVV